MKLYELTIQETHRGLKDKKFSAVEVAEDYLARIKKIDGKVKSFITVTEKTALEQAKEVDKKIKQGEEINSLAGIPASIKDVIVTKDILSTAASNILKNYLPPFDATAVKKLKNKGLVLLGKVNCDAFAHGASTENSDFFTTHNPWDLERAPGGSSGGSAAAVAADECEYSLGTDTGGSIRQPASFCGVVGLKPSYGRISRYGLMSMTSSTDCLSIIAKSVADAAIILKEIAGKDKKDGTASDIPVGDYFSVLENSDARDLKIGVPEEYFTEGMNPEVEIAVKNAISKFKDLGSEIIPVSLPHAKYAVPVYYIITPSEISSNLARYDGMRYAKFETENLKFETKNLLDSYLKIRGQGFGAEAKRRIMLGSYVLSAGYYDAYYLKAQKVRALIKKDFEEVFERVDILMAPVSPNVAFKIGAHSDNPLEMYLEDIFVSAVSLAGLPAISVPCGFAKDKNNSKEMPVGLQIIGRPFDELGILKAGYVYEKNTEWRKRRPEIK